MPLELRRKALHTVLALLIVLCTFFFSHEFFIYVGIVLCVFFILTRVSGISARVCPVERITFGELFFALGVLGAAIISHGNTTLFQLAIVILAFVDPLAALFGTAYGKHTYMVFDERRSIEGSLACFVSALCVLLVFNMPLLISLLTAAILTVIEACSLRGSDNLFLPVITIVILQFLL